MCDTIDFSTANIDPAVGVDATLSVVDGRACEPSTVTRRPSQLERAVLLHGPEASPFSAREFFAGKDAVTLATDILVLDQEQFSAALRKSPMKRAKMAGLQRNAAVIVRNAGGADGP